MKFTTLKVSAMLLVAGQCSVLQAQSTDTNEEGAEVSPVELEDLLVTTSLAPVPEAAVASTVTVITREEIEARQVKYLGDLLRDVPGFSVNQSGGAGTQTQLRVRGNEANQLLVLLDGVRANDPANSDEFQWQFALTSDIERIEIVRGPQSAIWGSDAMAGVVNIIRRRDSDTRQVSAAVELGSFDTGNAAASAHWAGDGLRLRAGAAWMDTDGINISRSGDEKDGAESLNGDLGLEWMLADELTLLASGVFVDATSEFDGTDFFVTGLPADADLSTDSQQAYYRTELRWSPAGPGWSASAAMNYADTETKNFSSGLPTSSTAAEVLEFSARASLGWGGMGASTTQRLTFAMDQREHDFSQRGEASFFGDPNQDQSMDITGFAAEYLSNPFTGFSWTISGRWDVNSEFENVGTWRIGGEQALNERIRLRGSYGTGSKTPTFTERFGFFPAFFIGNPDLEPEESKGWEVGVETDWLDRRLTLGGVYFQSTLENEINGFFFDPVLGASTAINEDGDSDRSGFELILNARPGGGWAFSGSYTYTDATEEDALGQSQREVRRPRHMASFNADWRFARERAHLNLNVNYVGKQLDLFFDPATFVSSRVTLDSYTVLDLAAAWRLTDDLELTFRGSNLTDEDYEEVLGYARPGRAWYAGLRGRFDF